MNKETYLIKAKLFNLVARGNYDIIQVCEDINYNLVDLEGGLTQRQVELVNAKEYTKEEILKEYNNRTLCRKWEHTIDKNGVEELAIVLD